MLIDVDAASGEFLARVTGVVEFVVFEVVEFGTPCGGAADRAGVGLRFVRDLEQGKETLRLDKVNQVLQMFGGAVSVGEMDRSIYA